MLHRLVVSLFLLFDLVLIFFFGTNFPYCLVSVCDITPLRSCLKVCVEKHYCHHHFWCDHVCIEPSRPCSPILGNNDNKLTDFFPQNENSFFVHIYINVLVILTSTWLVVATLLILLLFLIWQLNVFHSFKVCP